MRTLNLICTVEGSAYFSRCPIVVLEAVSDWRRQWQTIDLAESGYGRANDIDT